MECATRREVVCSIRATPPDLIVFEESPERPAEGLLLATAIRDDSRRSIPLVLLTSQSSEQLAVAALKAGVFDYITLPARVEDICASARRAFVPAAPRTPADGATRVETELIGVSAAMQHVRDSVVRLAAADTSVLITGETGTGKELAAELIHGLGARANRRMVSVNCAAIPDSLLEAELFGHERGAFTGADVTRDGQFQAAHRSTLFLDEVGDMTPYAQAKILRAIETRHVTRLGSTRAVPFDVRIIAATNHDLEDRVDGGAFRKDLFYRLYVAHLHVPPLRGRREDLPGLVDHYVRAFNAKFGRSVERLSDESMRLLLEHDWPGNVRQLRNLIEATFVNLPPRHVACVDLPAAVRDRFTRASSLPQGERDRLLSALFATNWNKSRAAQQLQWSRMTVYRKLAKYRLSPAAFARRVEPANQRRRG